MAIFSDINPATTSGTDLATLLNSFRDSVVSGFVGTSRPAGLLAGGYWVDNSLLISDNKYRYYMFDGSTDTLVFTINRSTGRIILPTQDSSSLIRRVTADAVGGLVEIWKSRIAASGQVLNNDVLAVLSAASTDDTGTKIADAGNVEVAATEDHTGSAQGTIMHFYTKNIGTAVKKLMISIGEGFLWLRGATSGYVRIKAAATTTSYDLTMPSAQGGAGQTLSNNGSGVLSWASAGGAITVAGIEATVTRTGPGSLSVVSGGSAPYYDFGFDTVVSDASSIYNNSTFEFTIPSGYSGTAKGRVAFDIFNNVSQSGYYLLQKDTGGGFVDYKYGGAKTFNSPNFPCSGVIEFQAAANDKFRMVFVYGFGTPTFDGDGAYNWMRFTIDPK